MSEPEQELLFDIPPDWKQYWKGMPGFEHVDLEPKHTIMVHFKDSIDRQKFATLVGQTITDDTKSLWYPKVEVMGYTDKRTVSQTPMNPRYPVYIISKGRWETRLTSTALERLGVPYWIVVEPQEYDSYCSVIDPLKVLKLPFSNLGLGSIPARNWVWEHAAATGAKRHWIIDDNIYSFGRFNNNLKTPVTDGTIFRAIEDFVDRYENVALAGMQYWMFILRKHARYSPVRWNTRIYSCILIKNDIPYRWRGRYNEDTDLSIRALKDGWCTALFNAFYAEKATTMTLKGGNTDELYKDDGRLKMAQSLKDQHPELVKITQKWGRWQHHVDYRGFRFNRPKLKEGFILPEGQDDYGMSLKLLDAPETVRGRQSALVSAVPSIPEPDSSLLGESPYDEENAIETYYTEEP
jgi:hypothetical protein